MFDTPFTIKVSEIIARRRDAASLLFARWGYPDVLPNVPNALELLWALPEEFAIEFFNLANWWGAPKLNFSGTFFDVDPVTGKRKLTKWAVYGLVCLLVTLSGFYIYNRGKTSKG